MPELPEVETVCRGLRKHIVGRTITKVVVRSDSAIHDQEMTAEDFRACVDCLLYTSPSPRDRTRSRMPSSA